MVNGIQSTKINANVRHAAGFGLGMEGHTKACGLYHRDVIGAIAHGQGVAQWDVQL